MSDDVSNAEVLQAIRECYNIVDLVDICTKKGNHIIINRGLYLCLHKVNANRICVHVHKERSKEMLFTREWEIDDVCPA